MHDSLVRPPERRHLLGGMALLGAAAALALAAMLSGCAATAKAGVNVLQRPRPEAPPAAPIVVGVPGSTSQPAHQIARSATVLVMYPDLTPAPGVRVQAVDADERLIDFTSGDDGQARLTIWTTAIPVWRAWQGGDWVALVPARVYPADDAAGFRLVLTLQRLVAQQGGKP